MADQEYNPVRTATTDPGRFSILGSSYDFGGPPAVTDTPGGTTTTYDTNNDWMSGISTIDPSTLTNAPGLPDFSSMSNSDLQSYLGSPDFTSLLSGLSGLTGGSGGGKSGSSGGIGSLLSSILGGGAGSTGLGPYAATAGIGIYEAKQAQKDAQAKADQMKALGQPFLDQSKSLLDQYKAGTLRPDQQQLVDFTSQQGQNLIQSGSALSAIAQQAFQDYQAGKLPAADEKRLQDQVTAQKQAVRQRLAAAGVVDSTILTGQDQLIDDQAMQQRQQLLDARFATGNQAYDQWLKSTEAGQALTVQGQQFASQAFETMLNDALGFGQAGMEPVASSIALAMQSDKELSDSITQLLGNLASAYAYTVAGPGNAGGGGTAGGAAAGGGGGGGGNTLSSILGNVRGIANLYDTFSKLFGFNGAGGQAAGITSSGTGAPAAVDIGSANLGSLTGGQAFGSSAAGALGSAAPVSGTAALAGLGSLGAGAMFGTSASAALGAAAPISDAAALSNLGSVTAGEMFGTSATGALAGTGASAGAGAAGGALGTASGGGAATAASGSAASASSAMSALGTVGAAAGLAVGFVAAAQALVHAFGGGASAKRNVASFTAALGDKLQTKTIGRYGAKNSMPLEVYNIPGKGWVTKQQFNDIAGAWYGATFAPDGDQAGWQQKLQDLWNNTKPLDAAGLEQLKKEKGGKWDDAAVKEILGG